MLGAGMIPTHAIAALIAASVAGLSAWQVQSWRYDSRISKMEADHAQAMQQAEQAARGREQALTQARKKAEDTYVEEKRRAADAATRSRDELGVLRNQLYAIGPAPARQNPATPLRVDGPGVERQLLGECAEALQGMAAEADRLAAVVGGLQGYVRNVCQAPQ